MNTMTFRLVGLLAACAALASQGATYQVGPTRGFTQLSQVAGLLNPGDVVEVDGNATYNRVTLSRSGSQATPITLRGMAQGANRPIVTGGGTLDALRIDADHYVVEDMVLTNGTTRCVFLHGNNLTLRRVQVHTCRDHGILGADFDTGDMLLTEVEVYDQGNSTTPNSFHHPIYIATDNAQFPNATLRIEKSWIHDNFSGNSVKSRAHHVKLSYNWIEAVNGQFHTAELIGPDDSSGATACPVPTGSNDAALCSGELVGNVLISRGNNATMIRLGSDMEPTGNGSRGRYHLVNNTIVLNNVFGSLSPVIRAFGELQSIEMHNNIIWGQSGDSLAYRIVRDVEANWIGGVRRVIGTKNLVAGSASSYSSGTAASEIAGLTQTVFATTASVFANSNLGSPGTLDLRLPSTSPARLAGNAGSTATAGYQIPTSTNLPTLQPPLMRPSPGVFTATTRPQSTDVSGNVVANAIAIGAFEFPFVAAAPPTGPLAANPTTLDFGGQSMSTTSPPLTVTFTNTSGAPITVASVTATTGYSVTANTCGTVNAGATCTASVTFTPPIGGATGPANGTLTAAYSGGPTGVSLTGTAERSLVTHYYRSILRRAPDAGGKAFWESEANRVANLGANVNEVWYAMAQTFYFSAEYTSFNRTNTGFVTDLYVTFYNRQPDSGGLNYWVGNLSSGMPREVVLAEFMFSTEFGNFAQAIFGNPSVRAELNMVSDFYRGILSRLPDDSGFNFWIQRFRIAQCQGQAAVLSEVEAISSAFALSAEYAARARSNPQYVGDLYNAFLRRGGDLAGVQYWINQIAAGARTREQVRVEFKNSAEFQVRTNAVVNAGCSP